MIWGIDPDTTRVALAIRDLHDADDVELVSLDIEVSAHEPERLYRMFTRLTVHAPDWMKRGFPVCIAIEKPISRASMSDSLLHNYGVLLAGLQAVLGTWTPNVAWLEVVQSQWKKATLGTGVATADDYCKALRDRKVAFNNPDEAAAYWIAEYAAGRITIS